MIRRGLSHQSMDVASGHVFDVQLSLLDGNASRMHESLDMTPTPVGLRTHLADLWPARTAANVQLPDLHYSIVDTSRSGTAWEGRARNLNAHGGGRRQEASREPPPSPSFKRPQG